jgi:murein DD-endopeptidase MepM/ murein hydrolase activator NlpD
LEKPTDSRYKRFKKFLNKKFRLVILSDTTLAEKFSVQLKPLGILIATSAITIVMTTLIISMVAFTPLREYIPGYGDIGERKQILELNIKADSLEKSLQSEEIYVNSLINVLNEKVEGKTEKPKRDTTGKHTLLDAKPSAEDIQFRKEFEKSKSNASIAQLKSSGLNELVFFAPVKGIITSSYNIKEGHYGVDVVTRAEETIKTTLDGTVVFTGFTAQDGEVIQIQHANNTMSIYKHCSATIKIGDKVKSGDAIGIVGNTGERSNGPHLHFELWFNGSPVNPQEFVSF